MKSLYEIRDNVTRYADTVLYEMVMENTMALERDSNNYDLRRAASCLSMELWRRNRGFAYYMAFNAAQKGLGKNNNVIKDIPGGVPK